MAPDRFQEAWQSQTSQTRFMVDADLLLKIVERNQLEFRTVIFLRDFREVGVAIVMLPLWFYLGIKHSLPWTWYLSVPALIWMAGFLVVDRLRHKKEPSKPGEPLLQAVNESLSQTEHQIGLLRNVFWWYLLPLIIPLLAFVSHVSLRASRNWLEALGSGGFAFAFFWGLYYFLDYINQRAVHAQLEPRRQELLSLLANLGGDESTADHDAKSGAGRPDYSKLHRRWFVVAVLLLMILSAIALVKGGTHQRRGEGLAKKSPFAAVRWQATQPEVKVGGAWLKLISLDDLTAEEIVAFSQRTYGDIWKKRFEEDLVELLTRMGHPTGDTVKLIVQPLTSSETRVLEKVPMTDANRRAIRSAAQERELLEPSR